MDDPDEALNEIRKLAERVIGETPYVQDIVGMVRRFQDLDAYLSTGGHLPTAWSNAPRKGFTLRQRGLAPLHVPHPEPEPLGGPIPGCNGSHLPEDDDA